MRWAPSGFRKKICPCKARRRTERTGKKYENRIHGLTVQRNLKPFVMQATAGGAPFLERRLSHRRALAAPQMARRFSRLPIKRRLQITTRTGGCPPGLPCRTAGNNGERQAKEQSNFQGGKRIITLLISELIKIFRLCVVWLTRRCYNILKSRRRGYGC